MFKLTSLFIQGKTVFQPVYEKCTKNKLVKIKLSQGTLGKLYHNNKKL